MRKRMTSLLLTLVMLLSLVPAMGVTASAAEPEWTTVNTFDQLKEAMQQGTKTNIKLGKDINTNDEENHRYGLTPYDTIKVGNTITLDLNGKKLTLNSGNNRMSLYIRVVAGRLTVQDSVGGGEIFLNDEYKGGSSLMQVEPEATFTLKSGTLRATTPKPRSSGITLIENVGTVNIEGGTLTCTQKDGSINANGQLDDWSSCYALLSRSNSDSVQTTISGGTFTGYVEITVKNDGKQNTISGGTFNSMVDIQLKDGKNMTWAAPGLTISGGTFKESVYIGDVFYHEKNTDVAVIISGGTYKNLSLSTDHGRTVAYDYDLFIQTYNAQTGYDLSKATFKQGYASYKILGGTYENLSFGIKSYYKIELEYVHEAFRSLLNNGGIKVGDTFYSYLDIEKIREDGNEWFEPYNPNKEPITVIPNAAVWGVKSVTLDGEEIDYFKDWTGEWKRIKNNQDHTLVFEWYPLSSDMINSGYTYDAKYLLHRTNSTDEPTPIPVDTSKNTLELKINKSALPGGYSYDFRLDLKKNGVDLSSSTNQHIVMLVVDPAQEIDTRTPIDSVTLNVPKLKEGDKSGADFTLSGTNTGVNSTVTTVWENIPSSGAVAGKFCVARITLTAEDGYAFNTKTQVNLNGDYSSKGSGIDNGGAGMTVLVSVPVRHEHTFSGEWQNLNNDKEYHFKTCSCGAQEKEPHNLVYNESLDKYQCSCGYEMKGTKTEIRFVAASPRSPIDGESPNKYTPEQWVHNIGKNYTVASIDWKDKNGNAVTTFESGKIYKGTVTFKADDRFKFDKDKIQFDRIFDTSTTETVEGYSLDEGATTLIATFKLKDNTVVRPGLQVKVELPTLSDKIGQNLPAAKLVDTTLPDDVELTTSVYENIVSGEPITGLVEPNKTYFYAVWLKLGNNDSVEAITKKYNVSYTVTDGGDAEYHTDNLAGFGVLARYQTPAAPDTSKISSVALTVTAPKYGEAPETSATGANNTLYTVDPATWSPAVTDGKFGADTYTVSIPVTAKSGYSFDTNCLYTVNGYAATYADGKVSYTFPALTAPHIHDYTGQPWQYLNSGSHYQACSEGDGALNIKAHDFNAWTKDNETTHSRTCSECKKSGESANYTETAEHTWVWVVDREAALNQPGEQHEECTGCHAKRGEHTEIPALRDHAVTVTGGTATAAAGTITRAMEGVEVTVTAQAPAGKHFVKWVVKTGGVTLANETSATTTFIMPAMDVAIEANFEKNASTGGGGGGGVTTYPITVKSAKNGDVTASHKTASKGTTVTLTVDPDKGYVLDTLTVLDGKDKEIKLTEKNGKYTFTMPASKVTVAATFKASAPTGKNPFIDVPAGSYYEDAVVWAVEKGITSGTSAVTFDPNGNCTRAQAVTFLWRAAGSPAPKTKVMPFTDVPSGSYYYDAVLWAMEQGITKGTSDTAFSPNASCTRAQIVTFLWRANGSPAVSGNSAFTDVASDAYYAAAVTWAEKNNVTGGIGNGLFGSNNNCTRAQIVTFLYRSVK